MIIFSSIKNYNLILQPTLLTILVISLNALSMILHTFLTWIEVCFTTSIFLALLSLEFRKVIIFWFIPNPHSTSVLILMLANIIYFSVNDFLLQLIFRENIKHPCFINTLLSTQSYPRVRSRHQRDCIYCFLQLFNVYS